MTLYSPLRSQAGHVLRPPAQKPAHPGMSWAEMARREGHRGKAPASPIAGVSTENDTSQAILRVLSTASEPISTTDIADACGRPRGTVKNMVYWLRHAGKIRRVNGGKHVMYEAVK